MKHIITILSSRVQKEGGCGECQASCQSACKTSCTVANQSCVSRGEKILLPRKQGA
jgi:predicted ribosomally synthesized six-cysteine peptide SCIFF